MSKETLIAFLESLNEDLTRKDATEDYRTQTANKLTHTVTISRSKIDRTIRVALEAASNVSGNGNALLKEVSRQYNTALDTLMTEIRQNFKSLVNKRGDTVKFIRGSRSGNVIKVIIMTPEGTAQNRDNFGLAQKQYSEPLQNFYENFLEIINQPISRPSTSNKEGKVDLKKAGQVFNLEHFKNSSNVRAFLADTIHDNLMAHYTKDQYGNLEADLKKLGLKTKLEIKKNAKTGEVKVFLGSQILNVAQSASEQKLKKGLQDALTKAIDRLKKDELLKLKGSASIADVKKQKVVKSIVDPFRKVKGVKVTSDTAKKKITKTKSSAKVEVSPRIKKGGAVKPQLRKRKMKGARLPKTATGFEPLQLLGILNQRLPEVVRKNMVEPRLVNRSGRFASSVKVTDISKTPQGFPSIGYTYQRDPYEVFEEGSKGNWSNGDRDPRELIDKSIREIAANFAIGRFYTRRM